jgi:hypothetical protein
VQEAFEKEIEAAVAAGTGCSSTTQAATAIPAIRERIRMAVSRGALIAS